MRGIVLFFFLLGQCLSAQEIGGRVIDEETLDPLIGANITAVYKSDTVMTTTDLFGSFKLANRENLVSVVVSYLGYNTSTRLYSGEDQLVFLLSVNESNIAINPIIIANPFLSNDVSFNRKEFQILPGAYEDPSRLLLKAPGFSTSNDQANSILYKGFPSNLINWNVNGALIVNPNHLSNAGTLSDVSSANAGGVNMISGQVIGKYDFQGAPFNLPGNNSIAGNSNIEFSDFNSTYLNLSLIGLEAGLGYNGEKLPGAQINYRYSTVGILTGALGLDFGGEEIVYQDLFGKVDIIDKEDEELIAHFTVGISHNYKDSIAVRDSAETFKDLQNIYFDSQILLGGLQYSKKWENLKLNSAINFSSKTDVRSSNADVIFRAQNNEIAQSIISGVVSVRKGNFNTGLNLHHISDSRQDNNLYSFGSFNSDKSFMNTNLFPFANYQWENRRFYLSGGMGVSYNSLTQNTILEPSAKAIVKFSQNYSLEFSYRRNSQLIPASQFAYEFDPEEIIGNHVEAYFRIKQEKLTAFLNGFYHYMTNILVEEDSYYSQFTGVDRFLIGDVNYDGEAVSTGTSIGFSMNNVLIENLNIGGNATFFISRYSNSEGFWTANTFDFNNSYNFLVSYQRKMKKDKEWLVSLSTHSRQGLLEFPINTFSTAQNRLLVYDFNQAPLSRIAAYRRVDFRFIYNLRKGSHRKFAKSISLDIQNIGNVENAAFTNYDYLTNTTFVQNQLGLIPVLAYRIEF